MNRIDALVSTLAKPRKHLPVSVYGDNGRCPDYCPGGNRCACDRNGQKVVGGAKKLVRHTLHICEDEDCICHSERRYALARRRRS